MKKLVVSDLFFEIYKDFNVFNLKDKLDKLTRRELLLMLIVATDNLNEDDLFVLNNIAGYVTELNIIYDSLGDLNEINTTDIDLLQLIEDTGDKYIDTNCIVDCDGNTLPVPLTESEALLKRRNDGLDTILE